jgi:hypothetical protein
MRQTEPRTRPPRLAAWLVNLFASVEDAESILGDLHEEFSDIVSKSGVVPARRWYWRQSVKTIVLSSLSPKDRVSLCSFTFADGRRCRTPRLRDNSHFCPYHAQKEDRARAAQKLGKDLDYFFSADYLSACDLSTALARIIPAVVRGDVKSKTAHTVAYLAQTLMQAIHISQDEYINAFGMDGWRKSIRNSVNHNYNYRLPPAPQSQQPQSSPPTTTTGANSPAPAPPSSPPQAAPVAHLFRGGAFRSPPAPSPAPAPQPAPSTHTSLPPTSAEFAHHVLAGRNLSRPPRLPRPGRGVSRGSKIPALSGRGQETSAGQAPQPALASSPTSASAPSSNPPQPALTPSPSAKATPPQLAAPPVNSSDSPLATSQSPLPSAQPNNPPPTASPTSKPVLPLDSRALHYDHNYRLRIDGKPF